MTPQQTNGFDIREEIENVSLQCAMKRRLHQCKFDCANCPDDIRKYMLVSDSDRTLLARYSDRKAEKAVAVGAVNIAMIVLAFLVLVVGPIWLTCR